MPAYPSPPEVLLRAASKARSLRGRVIVVKLGGSAMEDPAATRGTLESVVALQTLGVRQVLVHGGGKPIDRAMAAAGIEPRKVAGRRYTDEKTLGIVVRVLKELNAAIVGQLLDLGGNARGFPTNPADPDFSALWAERLVLHDAAGEAIDLGFVGRVTEVQTQALDELDYGAIIPVVASYAQTGDGKSFLNVNADTAASAVAGAMEAEACYFLTDAPGVLRDVKDPGSLIPQLTRSECEYLIRDGVIAGGMVPKVEACFEALDAGAGRAVVLDGRDPHSLLREFCGEPAGTVIVP
jgi:acetylglutamate kinase